MNLNFIWGQLHVGAGALKRSGFLRSLITGKPVTHDGQPLPWLTYAAINEICRWISKQDRVLEIGSGNSSLWFASRVETVDSVETSKDWAVYVQAQAEKRGIKNLTVHVREHFDLDFIKQQVNIASVVLIDGAWRDLVAKVAAEASPDKLIIIDNTDASSPWESLPKIFETRRRTVVRLRSMGPCLLHEWETSLVFPSSTNKIFHNKPCLQSFNENNSKLSC